MLTAYIMNLPHRREHGCALQVCTAALLWIQGCREAALIKGLHVIPRLGTLTKPTGSARSSS